MMTGYKMPFAAMSDFNAAYSSSVSAGRSKANGWLPSVTPATASLLRDEAGLLGVVGACCGTLRSRSGRTVRPARLAARHAVERVEVGLDRNLCVGLGRRLWCRGSNAKNAGHFIDRKLEVASHVVSGDQASAVQSPEGLGMYTEALGRDDRGLKH
jgi:hypothetical protein